MKSGRATARDHSRGFTLIELLAALTLAALLVVTTSQLLGLLHRQKELIDRRTQTDDAWLARTLQSLEEDLQNSRRVRPVFQGFELSGFASQNSDGSATQQPVLVSWVVDTSLDRNRLIRSQQQINALSNRRPTRDVFAFDVDEVSLWFSDVPGVRFFGSQTISDWSPLPASVICELAVTQNGRQWTDRRTMLLKAMSP